MTCIGFALGIFIAHCDSAPAAGPPPAARFCKVQAAPFRYSRHDTAETRRQLRVANARWRAVCGDR